MWHFALGAILKAVRAICTPAVRSCLLDALGHLLINRSYPQGVKELSPGLELERHCLKIKRLSPWFAHCKRCKSVFSKILTCSVYNKVNHELKCSLLGARRLKPICAQKQREIESHQSNFEPDVELSKTSAFKYSCHCRSGPLPYCTSRHQLTTADKSKQMNLVYSCSLRARYSCYHSITYFLQANKWPLLSNIRNILRGLFNMWTSMRPTSDSAGFPVLTFCLLCLR